MYEYYVRLYEKNHPRRPWRWRTWLSVGLTVMLAALLWLAITILAARGVLWLAGH